MGRNAEGAAARGRILPQEQCHEWAGLYEGAAARGRILP